MKKAFSLITVLIVSGAIIAVAVLGWWGNAQGALNSDSATKRFLITKGSSIEEIGKKLEEKEIIKSGLAFKIYVQINSLANKIPPGEFELYSNQPLSEVIQILMKGPIEVWVTVPEGLRREQIASRFSSDANFQNEFLNLTRDLEGYLFPDTYLVPKDIVAAKVVDLMRATFDMKFTSKMREDLKRTGLDIDEAVTLASIIERETLSVEERPLVAGLYIKRLNADWPLQADATVQYVVGEEGNWWPRPLTRADLNTNSRYNTYEYPGLPPGPIANPGITSLEAVVYPEESNYWYYLHDESGIIRLAETLEQHNANIRKYLR